jgi:hypothetical protein
MENYKWDGQVQRYRNKQTGQFVRTETILKLTEQNMQQKTERMLRSFDDVKSGKISLSEYQRENLEIIKYLHTQQYLVAKGGFRTTTPEDYLEIARELKNLHYPSFRSFTEDLRNGALTEGQARARIRNFGKASETLADLGHRSSAKQNGLTWARRYLSAVEHCPDCPIYAAMGAVTIDNLILPGRQCECRFNCKCYVRYFKTREEAIRS